MAKQNEALFEESSQGAVSAVTALTVIISVALMIGGILLSSYAFDPVLAVSQSLWLFVGGLVATILGFAIPFTLLTATGK